MSISLDRRVAESVPSRDVYAEPITVRRTWLVRSTRLGTNRVPILTGVFGFPWRDADLDAKCTIQVRDAGASHPGRPRVDRHHPAIPDPRCTCGIYGTTSLLEAPAADLLPSAVPVVTGFVELSGRLIAKDATIRAQHARIVGPLTVGPGRPPVAARLARKLGFDSRPTRVTSERGGYRVVWGAGRVGLSWGEWLEDAADALTVRYRVEIVVP
jgi:hypothetical protein